MHPQELRNGEIHDEVHVLGDLRNDLALAGEARVRVGRLAVDAHCSPGGRISLREAFDVGEKAAFACARRTHKADDVAGTETEIEFLRLAALVVAAKYFE